jgi:hypothetical protein
MGPAIHPNFDISYEFEAFAKMESSSHKPRRAQSELARPSGELTAQIVLYLHHEVLLASLIIAGCLTTTQSVFNTNGSVKLSIVLVHHRIPVQLPNLILVRM